MIQRIKNWFEGFNLLSRKLDMVLSRMQPREESIVLMRHLLGSIDLSDVPEEKEMSEGEEKEYCAAISAVFPRLEKDIKKFLYDQLHFSSNQADTWERVIFGRGTFNGMDILLNHWRIANNKHLERSKPKEEFDASHPLPEI